MDNRAIGVFDSGLGGLTALSELICTLPNESTIYFGDTGRIPYGSRSEETITKYSRQGINFLRSFDIKLLIAACGTVSSVALPKIKGDYDIPIIGVVESAAKAAALVTKTKRVGVIATAGTIRSSAYERCLHDINPDIHTVSRSCPLFVPLVENGRFKVGDIVAETVAMEYLDYFKDKNIDTLILGCTHYPLLSEIIANIMGDKVTLIDAGYQAAVAAGDFLASHDALCDGIIQADRKFFVSDDVSDFEKFGGMFLRRDIGGAAQKIDIEKY